MLRVSWNKVVWVHAPLTVKNYSAVHLGVITQYSNCCSPIKKKNKKNCSTVLGKYLPRILLSVDTDGWCEPEVLVYSFWSGSQGLPRVHSGCNLIQALMSLKRPKGRMLSCEHVFKLIVKNAGSVLQWNQFFILFLSEINNERGNKILSAVRRIISCLWEADEAKEKLLGCQNKNHMRKPKLWVTSDKYSYSNYHL